MPLPDASWNPRPLPKNLPQNHLLPRLLPPISDFVTTSEGPTPRFSSPGNEGYCTGAIDDDFEIPADLFFLETDQTQGFYVSVAFYLEGFDADCTSAGPVDAYIKRVDFGFGTR